MGLGIRGLGCRAYCFGLGVRVWNILRGDLCCWFSFIFVFLFFFFGGGGRLGLWTLGFGFRVLGLGLRV